MTRKPYEMLKIQIMTCSLSGDFISYNATFSHTTDLGGQEFSLVDNVTIHELIYIVNVTVPPHNDGAPPGKISYSPRSP